MKKIIGLSIAAIIVIALAGVGTFAFFSDTETSSANSFTAGTLNLILSDANQTELDGVTATWVGTDMAPGAAAVSGWVDLKNSGNVLAQHVEVKFVNTLHNVVTDSADLGADDTDVSAHLNVETLTYDGVDLLAKSGSEFTNPTLLNADTNGVHDGKLSLKELNNVSLNFTSVPSGATVKRLAMSVKLDSTTGNGNQGDSVDTLLTFGLFQDASQSIAAP
jgi:spore coat-associated protein N